MLPQDLKSAATTRQLRLHHPEPVQRRPRSRCVDGQRGGLAAIDGFLQEVGAADQASPAFRADGLLVITFDESDGGGARARRRVAVSGRCRGPSIRPGFSGPGGGRIGAVVLSPFVRAGTVSHEPYNHYSLLRTIEAIFALPPSGLCGRARPQGLRSGRVQRRPVCDPLSPLPACRHSRSAYPQPPGGRGGCGAAFRRCSRSTNSLPRQYYHRQ